MRKARFDKETMLPLMEAAGYLREEDFLASLNDERRELYLGSMEITEKMAEAGRYYSASPEERAALEASADVLEEREHWLEQQFLRWKYGKNFVDYEDYVREFGEW